MKSFKPLFMGRHAAWGCLWISCLLALAMSLPGCFYGSDCRQHDDCEAGKAFCREGSCWPNLPPSALEISTPQGLSVAVGESLPLSVSATDPEAQALTYRWERGDCEGDFSSVDASQTTWQPKVAKGEGCSLSVAVTDEVGGVSKASVAIKVLPANRPPTVSKASQSVEKATPGQAVTLAVVADDPEKKPLRFAWSAKVGTLGAPSDQDDRSTVTWQAPTAPAGACDAGVTVTITDHKGEKAEHTFAIGCAHLVIPLSSSREGYSTKVVADRAGNIYVAGVFSGDLVLGATTLRQRGAVDGYLAKFDDAGNLLWARQFGYDGSVSVRGLLLSADESLYLSLAFTGRSIEVGTERIKNTSRDVSVLSDSLIVKYTAKGEQLWLRKIISNESALLNNMVLDSKQGIVAVGHMSPGEAPVFQAPDGALKGLTTAPDGASFFVLSLSSDGAFQWMRGYGSSGVKLDPLALLSAPQDQLYVAGYTQSYGTVRTMKFGGKDFSLYGNSRDAFVMKLDSAGAISWFRHGGGSGDDIILGGTLHPAGGAYFVGSLGAGASLTDDQMRHEPVIKGSNDAVVCSIDAQGQYRWISAIGGGLVVPANKADRLYGVVTDGKRLFVTGGFGGKITIGSKEFSAKGELELLLAELRPDDGRFVWGQVVGGGVTDLGFHITIAASGALLVTGLSGDSLDFLGYPLKYGAARGGFVWRRDMP